jgi:hypothetical protein
MRTSFGTTDLVEMILAGIGKLFKISALTNSLSGANQAHGGM